MRRIMTGVALAFLFAACAGQTPAQRQTQATSGGEEGESNAAAGDPERHDAIERLFARKAGDLQSCWTEEYERTKNRKLEGDVTLQVVVAPEGTVKEVKLLRSTLNSPEIERCVEKAVAGWSFPEGRNDFPYVRTVHLGAQF